MGQSGVWYSTFAACRDASREGEGKGEEREIVYHVTPNLSRCIE